MADDRLTSHDNRDPITNAPGAHPVGTGVGAAGGAVAGAAAGAIAGPIGLAVGGVAGAVVGGLAGKAAAESVNPTDEDAYWRNNYETALASDWDTQRGMSTLPWDQARHATRAAWDRADRIYYAGDTLLPDEAPDDNEVVDTLNDLIETCCDGQRGFSACAKHTEATDLQAVFQKRARECGDATTELTEQVVRLGGEPTEGGTVSGALHRGWLAARSSLTGHSNASLLDECERGEDHALAAYRKALKQALPSDIRSLVQRQANGAQRNHDQIKALRDQAKSRD